jgi:hypothetical protein
MAHDLGSIPWINAISQYPGPGRVISRELVMTGEFKMAAE